MVGNVVRRDESIKVQDLLGDDLLPRLPEGNSSDGRDWVVDSLPVV